MKVFIIGNGYSINLVKILEQYNYIEKDAINLKNLFSMADRIPDRNTGNGYFCKYNFPNLWQLGVRSTIDSESASKIISNITSSYILYLNRCISRNSEVDKSHICVRTYFELNKYLKSLILYYDKLIYEAITKLIAKKSTDEIVQLFPLINEIGVEDLVISYNYDIWLERLLTSCHNKYSYAGITSNNHANIKIYKPHGSVNFDLCNHIEDESNIYDVSTDNLKIIDLENNHLPSVFNYSLIIPPSGFIIGQSNSWVAKIREGLTSSLQQSCPSKVVFYGLSYDIVDRDEINEIICQLDITSTEIVYVNPKPSSNLDYILSQHFEHYYHKKP